MDYDEMIKTISIQEIQKHPHEFLRRVEAGEALIVVRDNRPVAEIKPILATSDQPRPVGLCAGQFFVPADFDAPLPEEILREFEGQ